MDNDAPSKKVAPNSIRNNGINPNILHGHNGRILSHSLSYVCLFQRILSNFRLKIGNKIKQSVTYGHTNYINYGNINILLHMCGRNIRLEKWV